MAMKRHKRGFQIEFGSSIRTKNVPANGMLSPGWRSALGASCRKNVLEGRGFGKGGGVRVVVLYAAEPVYPAAT
jgi:hypothetical protein